MRKRCYKCKKYRVYYSSVDSYCKTCFKEIRKEFYQNNKTETLISVREWKKKNKEKQRGYVKTYMNKNKEIYRMYNQFTYYLNKGE